MRNQNLSGRLYRKLQYKPVSQQAKQMSPPPEQIDGNVQSQKPLIPKIALKHQLQPLQIDRLKMDDLIKTENIRSNIPTQSKRIYQAMRGYSPIMKQKLPALLLLNESLVSSIQPPTVKSLVIKRQMRSGSETKQLSSTRDVSMNNQKFDPRIPNLRMNNLLSPIDFIQFLKKDDAMKEEFCYLNKYDHPYDWRIVEFSKKNENEYMTISARGITKYINQKIEFEQLDEWIRESRLFHYLQQIEFFKTYKKWKSFKVWKRLMRRNIMKECAKVISSKLFYLDKTLRKPLLEMRAMCCRLEGIVFFEHRFFNTVELEEFSQIADDYKTQVFEKKVYQTDKELKNILIASCAQSFDIFKEENRITHRGLEKDTEDTKQVLSLMLEQKLTSNNSSIVIGDDSNLMMPYTQEATIKTHFLRLKGLIKLVDCLVLDAKLQLCRNGSLSLLDNIENLNQIFNSDTHIFGQVCWVKTECSIQDDKIIFNPNEQECISSIEQVVLQGISKLCDTHQSCTTLPPLQRYFNHLRDEEKQTSEISNILQTLQQDQIIQSIQEQIQEEVMKGFDYVVFKAKFLNKYLGIIKRNQTLQESSGVLDKKSAEEFKILLTEVKKEQDEISVIQVSFDLGFFQLDTNQMKQDTQQIIDATNQMLNDFIPSFATQRANDLIATSDSLFQKIQNSPATLKSFVLFQQNFLNTHAECENLSDKSLDIMNLGSLMFEFRIKTTEKSKELMQESMNMFQLLHKRVDEIQYQLPNIIERFVRELHKIIPVFKDKVSSLWETLKDSDIQKVTNKVDSIFDFIRVVKNLLSQLLQDQQDIEEYEIALGLEPDNFQDLNQFQSVFNNYDRIWKIFGIWRGNIHDWQREHFLDLDLIAIRPYIEGIMIEAILLKKELEGNEISLHFLKQTDEFLKIIDAVGYIREDAIGKKQWELIQKLFRDWNQPKQFVTINEHLPNLFEVLENPLYTLKYLISIGLVDLSDELQDISSRAKQESEFELQIQTVEQFWKNNTIQIVLYKDTKDLMLGNNEEIMQKIDDHLVIVNNLVGSKFLDPIRSRVEHQLKLLKYFQEFFEEWTIHQRNSIYLEPILNSNFAIKNLAKECKMFVSADLSWKKFMKTAKDSPSTKKWVEDHVTRNYFNLLKQNNQSFEQIKKALEDILDKKREVFQRFFFISNEELLEILSTCKFPQFIQPYLAKLFQSIKSLRFLKDSATAIISADGEELQLKFCNLKGEVEDWFKSVEESMKVSIKSLMRSALIRFENDDTKRTEWLQQNPVQVVLSIANVLFCRILEDVLQSEQNDNDLSDLYDQQITQIEDLQNYIRSEENPIFLRTAQQLMICDIYRRDQVESLNLCGVGSPADFKWLSFLKFYWEDETLQAHSFSAKLMYGYEFHGATSPMILTPLSERALIQVCQLIQQKNTTNLWGQVGCGKTELISDLSRSMGKYCLFQELSVNISFNILERLLIGAIYTGLWICFNNVESLAPRCISFVSKILISISQSLICERNELIINGHHVTLNNQVSLFATSIAPIQINGFQQVNMLNSDPLILIEVFFISLAVQQPVQKAKSLSSFLELVHIQIDVLINLRIVKLILQEIKKQLQFQSIESAIVKSLRDVLGCRLNNQDQNTLYSLIQTVFSSKIIMDVDMNQQVRAYCDQQKISCIELDKVLISYDLVMNRIIPTILGTAMTGKTTFIKIIHHLLENTMLKLNKDYSTINMISINAIGYPQYQIQSGLLQTILNIQSEQELQPQICNLIILVEGCQEAMITLLDSYNQFTSRLVMEQLSLQDVSPSLVSKMNIIYLGNSPHIEHFIWNQLQRLGSFILEETCQTLQVCLTQNIHKISQYLITQNLQICSQQQLIISSINLMQGVLENEPLQNQKNIEKSQKKSQQRFALWALLNVVYFQLNQQDQIPFEQMINETFQQESYREQLVYSLFNWNKPEGNIVPWSTQLSLNEIESENYDNRYVINIDNFKVSWYHHLILSIKKPILVTGVSGAGKSRLINFRMEAYQIMETQFYQQRDNQSFQNSLESRLQTQRRNKKIILTPQVGKVLIVQIDNLNLGSLSTLEFLRSIIEGDCLFDRKTFQRKEIECTTFVGTSSQKQNIPLNILNYFTILHINEPMISDVSNIFQNHFQVQRSNFSKDIREMFDETLTWTTKLLQTSREHFQSNTIITFTLHHALILLENLSKAFSQRSAYKIEDLALLWQQESARVFIDPIPQKKEQDEMEILIINQIKHLTVQQGDQTKTYLRDYIGQSTVINYDEFVLIIQTHNVNNLILFKSFVEDIIKVSRALSLNDGNVIIVGNQGTGKKSLVQIAGKMNDMQILFDTAKNFKDLQIEFIQILEEICINNKKILLIVNPKNALILQHIMNIIQYRDISQLIQKEDLDTFYIKLQQTNKEQQQSNPQEMLTKKLQYNLRIAILLEALPIPHLTKYCPVIHIQDWQQSHYKYILEKEIQINEEIDKIILKIYQRIQTQIPSCSFRSYSQLLKQINFTYLNQKLFMEKQTQILKQAIVIVEESRQQFQKMKEIRENETKFVEQTQLKIDLELQSYDTNKMKAGELSEFLSITTNKSDILNEQLEKSRQSLDISNKSIQDCMSVINSQLELIDLQDIQKLPHISPINQYQAILSVIFNTTEDDVILWMKNGTLVQRLRSVVYHYSRVDLPKVKKIINLQSEFKSEVFQQISQSAHLIYLWIQDCVMAFEISEDSQEKYILFKCIEVEANEKNKQKINFKTQLDSILVQIRFLEQSLKQNKNDIEKSEKILSQIYSQLDHVEDLIKSLDQCGILWEKQYFNCLDNSKVLLGNTILKSFQLVLFGGIHPLQREELLDSIKADLRNNDINYVDKLELTQIEILRLNIMTTEPLLIIDKQDEFIDFMSTQLTDILIIQDEQTFFIEMKAQNTTGLNLIVKLKDISSLQSSLWKGQDDQLIPSYKSLYFVTDVNNIPDRIFKLLEVQNFQLEDAQMELRFLNAILLIENPSIYENKNKLKNNMEQTNDSLLILQDQFLRIVSSLKAPLLESSQIINSLNVHSNELQIINSQVELNKIELVSVQIQERLYQAIAIRVNVILKCFEQLVSLNDRYVYSPRLIQRILIKTIQDETRGQDGKEGDRSWILINSVTEQLYVHVMTSIRPQFREAVSFIITLQIDLNNRSITHQQYQYLLNGPISLQHLVSLIPTVITPLPTFLSEAQWHTISQLHYLSPFFDDLQKEVTKNSKDWEKWMQDLPGQSQSLFDKLPPLEKLILVRTLKTHKLNIAMKVYVKSRMGNRFSQLLINQVDGLKFNPYIPTIFFCSQQNDPLPIILKMKKAEKFHIFSAEFGDDRQLTQNDLDDAIQNSDWIILLNFSEAQPKFFNLVYNCMQNLIRNNYTKEIGQQFSFIIIENKQKYLPQFLLSNSFKIFYELPQGIKQIMHKIYSSFTNKKLDECSQPKPWRKFLFSLCFLHSILLERNRLLKQNLQYSDTNLDQCLELLNLAIENSQQDIPYETLNTFIIDFVYNGEVDKKYLQTLVERCSNENVMNDDYQFFDNSIYKSVPTGNQMWYLEMISRLPDQDDPEILGMNSHIKCYKSMQGVKNYVWNYNDYISFTSITCPICFTIQCDHQESLVLTELVSKLNDFKKTLQ